MKKQNYTKDIVKSLVEINQNYPDQDLLFHVGLACSDYKDIMQVPDKELAYLLEKYLVEKSLDYTPNIFTTDEFDFDEEE